MSKQMLPTQIQDLLEAIQLANRTGLWVSLPTSPQSLATPPIRCYNATHDRPCDL